MKPLGPTAIPNPLDGQRTLLAEGSPAGPQDRKPTKRRNQAALEIQADVFSDISLQGLVDDWLVPMIVDQLIETMLKVKLR